MGFSCTDGYCDLIIATHFLLVYSCFKPARFTFSLSSLYLLYTCTSRQRNLVLPALIDVRLRWLFIFVAEFNPWIVLNIVNKRDLMKNQQFPRFQPRNTYCSPITCSPSMYHVVYSFTVRMFQTVVIYTASIAPDFYCAAERDESRC